MGHYVYQYLHPEYGHLYCGRTNDLLRRIYEHNFLKTDNIPREYETILQESAVMYVELQTKAQEIAVEAYCIDKYKPVLNIALKQTESQDCTLEMKLPKWQKFDDRELKEKIKKEELTQKLSDINREILSVEYEIGLKRKDLLKKRNTYRNVLREIKTQDALINIFGLSIYEVEWFYQHCQHKNVQFTAKLYDKEQRCIASGLVKYEGKELRLFYEHDNLSNSIIVNEKSPLFHIYGKSLCVFYPNMNIYEDLYISVISEMDKLRLFTEEFGIKLLLQQYRDSTISCWDTKHKVKISINHGIIVTCKTDRHWREYNWEITEGTSIKDDVKGYIYSAKYHLKEQNDSDYKFCEKILGKFPEKFMRQKGA